MASDRYREKLLELIGKIGKDDRQGKTASKVRICRNFCIYHGRDLNLVVRQSTFAIARLKSTNTSYFHVYNTCTYDDPLPKHLI